MNTWLQKLMVACVTILILGSVFVPAGFVVAQPPLLSNQNSGNGFTPSFLNNNNTNTDTNTTGDLNGNGVLLQPNTNTTGDLNGGGVLLQPNQNQTLGQTGSAFQRADSALPACGILPASQGTFEGCFVRFFYYVFLYPSAWLAGIAGQIFDYFIAFTLNSESYRSGGFVEQGWRVIRDFINASFIFILLYAAIVLIVRSDSPSMTRTLTGVIITAVIINFSLFATRVIVDAGNILGRVFYERIVVENDDLANTNNYTTISAGLVGKVNPQRLLSPDIFRKQYTTTSVDQNNQNNSLGGFSGVNNTSGMAAEGFAVGSGFMILVILVAAGINILLIGIFISVSIFLVARTLGLWIMMIMSPLAFASLSIPVFKKIPKFGFDEWLKQTTSLSFMVVVFMFFLYLTIMFIDISFATAFNVAGNTENISTVHLFMSVIIPVVGIWFLLKIAKDQAKGMAGSFGEMVGKAVKYGALATFGAAGLALGAAAGVGAVAGRQLGGRLGARIASKADTRTAMGRFKKRAGDYMSKASWDARKVNIPKPAKSIIGAGKSGLSYASGGVLSANDFNLTNLNTFGKPSDKGYAQRREESTKDKVEKAKKYKANEFTPVDVSGTYTYEEIDPTTGKVVKKTGTVSGSTSVNAAKSAKAQAQRELEAKKAEIHQNEKYDEKKRDLERMEKEVEEKEKAYKELLDRKKAGDPSVSQYMIDTTRDYLNLAKNGGVDPATGSVIEGVKQQKAKIKDIENMYIAESNKVAEAEARISAAERALAKRNVEILSNYADSLERWAAVPDMGLTHRYDGNNDAVAEIRDMSSKEEGKTDKK